MNSHKFSIISPVYGAANQIPELVSRIENTIRKITINYEIILVEDGSPDESWDIIKFLAENNDKIIGLSLSRNFGQQNALNAGFDYATGDYIVTLDCDLQDEPENIINLYNKASEGFDIVFASRVNRQDAILKKIASRYFYKILGYLTETEQDPSIANFILYKKNAINAMKQLGDYHRYYPLMNKWIGFRTVILPIIHASRKDKKYSSHSYRKRLKLALTTIISFSDKPLRLVLQLGIILVLLSFSISLILIIRYLITGIVVSGWLSVFLSIWLLSGIMIITLGLLGAYIGKIYETVKKRPTYLIKEVIKKQI